MMNPQHRNRILGIALGILVPAFVLASNLTLPYPNFAAGTPIRATEMNANFAQIQTAVNSKLDVDAGVYVSGTRLQVLAYRSADGVVYPPGQFFDRTVGVQCRPRKASDGVLRCLPDVMSPVWHAFNGMRPETYSNSSCTTQVFFLGEELAGWPSSTANYASNGQPSSETVYQMVSYTGLTWGWVYSDGGEACSQVTVTIPPRGLFTRGNPLAPMSFASFTPVPM